MCVGVCAGGWGGGVALLEPAIALALSASAEYPLRSVTSGGGAGVRVVLGCNRRKEPKKHFSSVHWRPPTAVAVVRRKRSLAAAYGGRCFVKEPPTAARLRRESHCLTPVSYKRSFFQVGLRVCPDIPLVGLVHHTVNAPVLLLPSAVILKIDHATRLGPT